MSLILPFFIVVTNEKQITQIELGHVILKNVRNDNKLILPFYYFFGKGKSKIDMVQLNLLVFRGC